MTGRSLDDELVMRLTKVKETYHGREMFKLHNRVDKRFRAFLKDRKNAVGSVREWEKALLDELRG